MRNYKLLGHVIQTATVLLGIYFVWSSHSLFGIMLFAGTAFTDFGLGSVHKSSTRTGIKLLLFMYGVMLWLMFTTPAKPQVKHINIRDSTLHARTRNIVPRNARNRHFSSKIAESKNDQKKNKNEDWKKALEKVNSLEHIPDKVDTVKKTALLGPSAVSSINAKSLPVINKIFGNLVSSDFPDLKYRTKEEVEHGLSKVFSELPAEGYLPGYKNPCWKYEKALNPNMPRGLADIFDAEGGDKELSLACLPFAYILGQPKCGTSDLFERLKRHPDIR